MAKEQDGQAIPVEIANRYIKKYLKINNNVGFAVNVYLSTLDDANSKIRIGKRFFKAIHESNAFVFDADIVKRFFWDEEGKLRNEDSQPTHFVVCLGGKLPNDEEDNEGEATVLVAGCKKEGENRYVTMSIPNPVSEHPGKYAVPELKGPEDDRSLVFFLKSPE